MKKRKIFLSRVPLEIAQARSDLCSSHCDYISILSMKKKETKVKQEVKWFFFFQWFVWAKFLQGKMPYPHSTHFFTPKNFLRHFPLPTHYFFLLINLYLIWKKQNKKGNFFM